MTFEYASIVIERVPPPVGEPSPAQAPASSGQSVSVVVEHEAPNKRGYVSFQPGPFDYSQLADDVAAAARMSAQRIRSSQRAHIIETGHELLKMKAALGHGHFIDWIDRELNFSQATARNYMAAARAFADKPLTVSVLPPGVVYRLAGAPEEVRAEIVQRVEAGELFDRDEVDDLLRSKRAEASEARKLARMTSAERVSAQEAKRRKEQRLARRLKADLKEDEERQRARDDAASSLVERLRKHFTDVEIAELNDLWVAASYTVRPLLRLKV